MRTFHDYRGKIKKQSKKEGVNMKDFLSLAKARYSVRKYKDTPIPEKVFARVLQAGQVAPTACNAQAVHVYVLKSKAALAKARSLTKFTFDAPAVLLVCYDSERTWQNKLEPGVTSGQQDAAIVATHIMLQAWEEGLGTCWVNLFPNSQAKEMLGLATNHVPVLLMPIGIPAEDATPSPMHYQYRDIDELVTML